MEKFRSWLPSEPMNIGHQGDDRNRTGASFRSSLTAPNPYGRG